PRVRPPTTNPATPPRPVYYISGRSANVDDARDDEGREHGREHQTVPAERGEPVAREEADEPAYRDRGRHGRDDEPERHRTGTELRHHRRPAAGEVVDAGRPERREPEEE